MAIKHFSYLDLSQERRAEAARTARDQIMIALKNPFLKAEQQEALYERMTHLGRWERGEVELEAPMLKAADPVLALPEVTSSADPTHHSVELVDTVTVSDEVGR